MTDAAQLSSAAIERAYRICLSQARAHYENFSIGSWLLPRAMRKHLAALYCFARTADDVADEGDAQPAERLARLAAIERALEGAFDGRADEPIFVALGATARALDLPIDPLRRLLDAFRSDVDRRPFATFADLRTYCHGSADPVGEIVLRLFGHREPALIELSDRICTGLQLANFWQDLSVDLARGRLYVPLEDLERFGVGEAELRLRRTTHRVRRLLAFEVERARELLVSGRALGHAVEPRLAREVRLFAGGGLAILARIERAGFEVLASRPTLGRRDAIAVAARALIAREKTGKEPAAVGATRGRRANGAADPVQQGYAACREVVRRSSSSFLPAFRLLPADRRDALCAVYAFCRHVDDIVDDAEEGALLAPAPAASPEAGRSDPARAPDPRRLLERWRGEVEAAYDGRPTRPISVAIADAAHRFALPKRLFLELIRGVEMDLMRQRYETFEELEEYCYLVASTVGLLCIEIFGYSNPSARDYARDLGIAFQLTNILRDVSEDARRGRIYLPREDLARLRCSEDDLLVGRYSPHVAALMAFECGRARALYLRAQGALAAEDRRSLAAAEVMRRIYERLLDRIEARNFDVFAARVAVSSYEKLTLALAGWGRARFAPVHA